MANKGNQCGFRWAWTADELVELDRLVRSGLSADKIARKLGRPLWAIDNRHELTLLRQGVVFSVCALGRLFGVDDAVVRIWQRHGWLPRTRNGRAAVKTGRRGTHSKAEYLITDTAIEAFLAKRETWYAWDPARITDPAWRALAESLRADERGRWLTTTEAANQLGVVVDTMRMWLHTGQTAGLRVARYGIHLYWWSEDLEAWVAPADRRRLRASGQTALDMARTGVTSTQLAAVLGVSVPVASNRLRLLLSSGLLRREADQLRPDRYVYWTIDE